MPELEEKINKEAKREVEVAACRFPFPTWTPTTTEGEGIDSVWLYKPKISNDNT